MIGLIVTAAVAWNASSGNPAGYKLYISCAGITNVLDVGNVTSFEMGLDDPVMPHEFSVSAYNLAGESPRSAPIVLMLEKPSSPVTQSCSLVGSNPYAPNGQLWKEHWNACAQGNQLCASGWTKCKADVKKYKNAFKRCKQQGGK